MTGRVGGDGHPTFLFWLLVLAALLLASDAWRTAWQNGQRLDVLEQSLTELRASLGKYE